MAKNLYPSINGIAVSWADIQCKALANGAPLLDLDDIKSFNSGRKVELGEQRAGGRVMKRTTGSGSQTCSVELYREGFQKFVRKLIELAPRRGNAYRISLVTFLFTVQHTPPGEVEIYERRVEGCRLISDDINGSEGDDPDVVPLELSTVQIVDIIDGKEVVLI